MTAITDINGLISGGIHKLTDTSSGKTANSEAFDSLLSSAMDMINETNTLASNAELEKMNFALGNTDNTHDLSIAMQKASLSLQYTVAVKNAVLDAYKEIMNIQI